MNKLTFRVKANDEVTLKHKIGDSTLMAQLGKLMYYWWSDKTIVVVYTFIRWSDVKNKYGEYVHMPHSYIMARDRSGNVQELPIESISRNYALRRDHKRYKLHNKILIVE